VFFGSKLKLNFLSTFGQFFIKSGRNNFFGISNKI
jgi:hypothetical protein